MPLMTMRQDFRAPAFGPASTRDIYKAALEQMQWADSHGFDFLVLSEHHGIDDGWMPAPITIAASILAMTERAPVLLSASILPLHDPIRVAEQIAVIDNAFPGRLWTVLGAGYRVDEFEMAGVDHARHAGRSSRSKSPRCSKRGPVNRSSGKGAPCASRPSRRRNRTRRCSSVVAFPRPPAGPPACGCR